MNETENGRQERKTGKIKSRFFEESNRITKPLARQTKKKENACYYPRKRERTSLQTPWAQLCLDKEGPGSHGCPLPPRTPNAPGAVSAPGNGAPMAALSCAGPPGTSCWFIPRTCLGSLLSASPPPPPPTPAQAERKRGPRLHYFCALRCMAVPVVSGTL